MELKNAKYNEDGSIDCELDLNGEFVPFTARKDDPEEHGRLIFEELKNKAQPYKG